jgi:uncharacterized protein (TIGR03118 family)
MTPDDLSSATQVQSAGFVLQTNLVSDGFVDAATIDPLLVNPWGVSLSATSPFWVSDNGSGVTTLYDGNGTPFPVGNPLVVTIPAPEGQTDPSAPTGQVFNGGSGGFSISESDHSGSATFIFATEDGTISAWNPAVDPTNAVLAVDNSGDGAVFKGLALASTDSGKLLFASDFHNGMVDVFDQNFHMVNSFTDPSLPNGYAPFNVQVLGGHLFVTFALQDADKHDDVAGAGHGFVDEFDFSGHLVQQVAANGPLDSPWGLVIAPASFGSLAGDLLVGNFGDGTIDVFDHSTNAFLGQLSGPDGQPLQIDGLWALVTGNGANGGDPNKVYFSAGPDEEAHGLFGSLTALPATAGRHGGLECARLAGGGEFRRHRPLVHLVTLTLDEPCCCPAGTIGGGDGGVVRCCSPPSLLRLRLGCPHRQGRKTRQPGRGSSARSAVSATRPSLAAT